MLIYRIQRTRDGKYYAIRSSSKYRDSHWTKDGTFLNEKQARRVVNRLLKGNNGIYGRMHLFRDYAVEVYEVRAKMNAVPLNVADDVFPDPE